MLRYSPEDEELKQLVDYILGGNLASYQNGQTFPGVLLAIDSSVTSVKVEYY